MRRILMNNITFHIFFAKKKTKRDLKYRFLTLENETEFSAFIFSVLNNLMSKPDYTTDNNQTHHRCSSLTTRTWAPKCIRANVHTRQNRLLSTERSLLF